MTREEALDEIKQCLLAGTLELTDEWGKICFDGHAFSDDGVRWSDWRKNKGLRNRIVF